MRRAVRAATRWLPHAWTVALAVLMLGPALGPGYVLSYDMVWVPDLALRGDFLGLGGGLPRAVPSDAVVAVLDEVVPGMLLQKVVLLGGLVLAGEGAMRLAGPGLPARLVAATVAVWNPFVTERLAIGHWPVLLGYAAVLWLAHLVPRARSTGRVPGAVYLLVPLGCLSPSAGLATAALVVVLGATRHSWSLTRRLVLLALAGNAPWVMASLVGMADPTPTSVGARLFNLRDEAGLPAPLTAVGLGGIWNSAVVPVSRQGAGTWMVLLVLLGLSAVGVRLWWRRTNQPWRWVACWVLGWGTAVFGWAAPGLLEWLGATIPGAGLLRDGTRYFALCAPLVVALAAAGTEVVVRRLRVLLGPFAAAAAAAALVLAPLAAMPDAAWGVSGALRPVSFPAGWSSARPVLAEAEQEEPGAVLVLPFTSYRAPSWNHGHRVLDPLGRFLTPDYVASDELSVSGIVVGGDDPRVPRIAQALAIGDVDGLRELLLREGVRYVVLARDVPAPATAVAQLPGRRLVRNEWLEVTRLDGVGGPEGHELVTFVLLSGAWGMYVLVPLFDRLDRIGRRERVDSGTQRFRC